MRSSCRYSWVFLAAIFCLCGCRPATDAGQAAHQAVETAVMASLPTPAAAAESLPSPSPAPSPTPEPRTISAVVNVLTLNLRAGPSMLHNILGQYKEGDTVTLLARAPGDEWVKVLGGDGKIGWMNSAFIKPESDVAGLPLAAISESLVLEGRVVNQEGTGIPGIQVAALRQGGAERVRVDGRSMADGRFFVYAPVEYQGKWLAAVTAVDCTSPIVDANCRYPGIFNPTGGIDLGLPTFDPVEFVYTLP